AVILWAADAFSGGPQLTVAHVLSPLPVIMLTVVLIWPRAPRFAAVGMVVALGVVLAPRFTAPPEVTTLTVTSFDVGQGDTLLVEVPTPGEPARMLIDGGIDPDLTASLLTERGIPHLDMVVV